MEPTLELSVGFFNQFTFIHMHQYSTTDLYLASAIIAKGFILQDFEKRDGKGIFYFEASHDIAEFVEHYFLHKGKIDNALGMAIAIKNLKNYLHNSQK